MTFIKDHMHLWEEIVKKAQAAPPVAPTAPATVDPSKRQELLNSLFQNLDSEIKTLKSGGTYTSTKDNSEVFFKDVSSIDNFLYFLYADSIAFNGKRLVIGSGAQHGGMADPAFATIAESKDEYVPYPTPNKSDLEKFKYYVHKQYVAEFLKNLTNQDNIKKNRLLLATVTKLIGVVSSIPGVQAIDQKKTEVATELLPTDLLDWWMTPNINLSRPDSDFMYNAPDKPVTVLRKIDLDSFGNFKKWLESADPYIEVNNRIINKSNADFNFCSVMQGLYKRALLRNKVPNAKSSFYINAIKTLAPQFNDPSGNACNIASATVQTQESSTAAGFTTLEQNAAVVAERARKLSYMVSKLPYRDNNLFNVRICLEFIEGFNDVIKGTDLESSYGQLVNKTKAALNVIRDIAKTDAISMIHEQGAQFGSSDSETIARFDELMFAMKRAITNIGTILRLVLDNMQQAKQNQIVSELKFQLRVSDDFYRTVSFWANNFGIKQKGR